MRLNNAMLCLDCEHLHEEWRCPYCASFQMFPIAKWLNRKPVEVPLEIMEVTELERLFRLERKWK